MKKVLLFVAVVTAASFASCKKDRVCTCTSSYPGQTTTSTPVVTTYPSSKKAAARSHCLSTTTTSGSGVIVTNTCDLN